MKKRTIIILTTISIIISLGIILLTYFGIDRYTLLQIHKNNEKLTQKYIENYSKLEKHKIKDKVIISTYTTPERINKIRPMINSILDQTVKVDEIGIVIQEDKKYIFPDYLNKIVKFFPAGKDYGKGNKIIPILFKEKECNTTIIALDDNIIYGKDFIQTLLEERDKNPGFVIVDNNHTCLLFKPENYGCEILKRDRDIYDEKWFLENTKNSKIINYYENYKL